MRTPAKKSRFHPAGHTGLGVRQTGFCRRPRRGADRQTLFVEGFVRGAVGADKARFDSLLDHVRAIVSGAGMFDPKTRMKIGAKADKLWAALRNGRKRQLLVAR
jgi:hypothetical protein